MPLKKPPTGGFFNGFNHNPDWGELQLQFLSDHARTGISLEAWCERQELKFNTARRYIKIKSAQKEVRIAQSEQNGQSLAAPKQATQEVDAGGVGNAKEIQSLLKSQHEQFAQNMPQKEAVICADIFESPKL